MGSELFRNLCIVVGERCCSWFVGHCSFADEQLGLELVQGLVVGNCSFELEQMGGGLERQSGHHLGILGCSIFRRMLHHQTVLTCHRDRHNSFVLELVDIVVEQLVELAVVVLVVQLANGLRLLGIYYSILNKIVSENALD